MYGFGEEIFRKYWMLIRALLRCVDLAVGQMATGSSGSSGFIQRCTNHFSFREVFPSLLIIALRCLHTDGCIFSLKLFKTWSQPVLCFFDIVWPFFLSKMSRCFFVGRFRFSLVWQSCSFPRFSYCERVFPLCFLKENIHTVFNNSWCLWIFVSTHHHTFLVPFSKDFLLICLSHTLSGSKLFAHFSAKFSPGAFFLVRSFTSPTLLVLVGCSHRYWGGKFFVPRNIFNFFTHFSSILWSKAIIVGQANSFFCFALWSTTFVRTNQLDCSINLTWRIENFKFLPKTALAQPNRHSHLKTMTQKILSN